MRLAVASACVCPLLPIRYVEFRDPFGSVVAVVVGSVPVVLRARVGSMSKGGSLGSGVREDVGDPDRGPTVHCSRFNS